MKKFIVILFALFLVACANVVAPTGGPKDEMPPLVISSRPINNSTNFQDRTVRITFDEYITLSDVQKNIMVSPPTKTFPNIRMTGKTMVMRFHEDLQENTTYSISFGEAVKDLHEGNVMLGYNLVFSTGDIIDSLCFEGKVASAFTLKPVENMYVMLYDASTVSPDSLNFLPLTHHPDYITTCEKNGHFFFFGLPLKPFYIFAIKDLNSNRKFDLPNEEIAFKNELFYPLVKEDFQDSTQRDALKINMYSFVQQDSVQRLLKKELVENGVYHFAFKYPADAVELDVEEEHIFPKKVVKTFSQNRDTITFFCSDELDSLTYSMKFDTVQEQQRVSLNVKKKKRAKADVLKPMQIKALTRNGFIMPGKNFEIAFSAPIHHHDADVVECFICEHDTLSGISLQSCDENNMRYALADVTLHEGKQYKLVLRDSVFFNVLGETNEQKVFNFAVAEESQFGNVYVKMTVPEGVPQLRVELIDDKEKVVDYQILTTSDKVRFYQVNPGKYRLKIIHDLDRNGVWTPGDLRERRQPEKVEFYEGVLEVRANWDIDI